MKITTQLNKKMMLNYSARVGKIVLLLANFTNEWTSIRILSKNITTKNNIVKLHVFLNQNAKANLLGHLIKMSDDVEVKKDFKTHKHRLILYLDLKKTPP